MSLFCRCHNSFPVRGLAEDKFLHQAFEFRIYSDVQLSKSVQLTRKTRAMKIHRIYHRKEALLDVLEIKPHLWLV